MEKLTLVSEDKLLELFRELESLQGDVPENLREGTLANSLHKLEDLVSRLPVAPVRAIQKDCISHVEALATRFKKKAELRFSSPDLHVSSELRDVISEVLVHLIRNAVDHGMDTPMSRKKAGKPSSGLIELQFRLSYSRLLMRFADDGRGVDSETVLRKAQSLGLIESIDAPLSRDEIFRLILAPQFSTRDDETEVSGRGVGLSAVAALVHDLSGEVQLLDSITGGLEVVISLPLQRVGLPAIPAWTSQGEPFWLPDDLVFDLEKNWANESPFLLEKNKLNWDTSRRSFRLFFQTSPKWQDGGSWREIEKALTAFHEEAQGAQNTLAARPDAISDPKCAARAALAPLLDRELFLKLTTR